MSKVDLDAAKSRLLSAMAGEELARLVALEPETSRRRPGGWEGRVWMADDLEAPLPSELLAAFSGDDEPALEPE